MVQTTIPQRFTLEDNAYLLAFEAKQVDESIKEKRDSAYMSQDFSLATRLERYSMMAQKRLNRRFLSLVSFTDINVISDEIH